MLRWILPKCGMKDELSCEENRIILWKFCQTVWPRWMALSLIFMIISNIIEQRLGTLSGYMSLFWLGFFLFGLSSITFAMIGYIVSLTPEEAERWYRAIQGEHGE